MESGPGSDKQCTGAEVLAAPPLQDDLDAAKPGAIASSDFFAPVSSSWSDIIERTEHNLLFLNCDYASTSLGKLREWSTPLRLYASMLFSDTRASCIYWGRERIAFYNDKFAVCCGGLHPYLMGKSFKDAFPTLLEQIEPIFQQVTASGKTSDVDNIVLFPVRNGFLEETYFIGQFMPLRGPSGEVEGFYNTCYDSTLRVLYERRRRVVEQIAAMSSYPLEKTLSLFMEALRENPKDITMAMLYCYDEKIDGSGNDLRLYDAIAVPPGHRCAPREAKLETDQVGLLPYFRKARLSGMPLVLSQSDGSLQAMGNMFDDIAWCGYGEPARHIVITSLSANGTTLGFYVQGTNSRGAYDETTERSIIDVVRQMESKWMISLSIEQARQREMLLERRAVDSENRLRYMAKRAPIGMCQVTPEETIKWANDQYYHITGHERSNPQMSAFRDQMADDEDSQATEKFQSLLHSMRHYECEIRLKRQCTQPAVDAGDSEEYSAWILAVSFPIMEDGKPKLVMTYVSDISHQKWAEGVQARNAAAAILAKRRQDEFIDTTSHEMRNPLSAITQLADGISKSLADTNQDSTVDELKKITEENIDAANTILACAAHQRRVIDDVLILSRLESHMLSITPVVEQTSRIVANTIKMFSGEVAMSGIQIEAVRDYSYDTLHLDYVLVDTSRLTQILINLISNSIKFSADQPTRRISLVYGAQTKKPPRLHTAYGELRWLSTAEGEASEILPALGPEEDALYLYFCVQDTGKGMSDQEMNRLFKRYSQGTSKTHITYGGSGLGLYICRQLAEKQGGGIGVCSELGKGSTFAFFVETRTAEGPDRPLQQHRPPQARPREMDEADSHLPRMILSPKARAPESTIASDQLPHKNEAVPAKTALTPSRSTHVLLVEDNLINQKVLARQLRNAGFTVTVANHGGEAIDILETAGHWHGSDLNTTTDQPVIDIVLMDWEMPIMNGLECCAEIRA